MKVYRVVTKEEEEVILRGRNANEIKVGLKKYEDNLNTFPRLVDENGNSPMFFFAFAEDAYSYAIMTKHSNANEYKSIIEFDVPTEMLKKYMGFGRYSREFFNENTSFLPWDYPMKFNEKWIESPPTHISLEFAIPRNKFLYNNGYFNGIYKPTFISDVNELFLSYNHERMTYNINCKCDTIYTLIPSSIKNEMFPTYIYNYVLLNRENKVIDDIEDGQCCSRGSCYIKSRK